MSWIYFILSIIFGFLLFKYIPFLFWFIVVILLLIVIAAGIMYGKMKAGKMSISDLMIKRDQYQKDFNKAFKK